MMTPDPTSVTELLATYGGLSILITALVGGVKKLFPAWAEKKEAVLSLAIALVVGGAAKFAGFYAGNDAKSWMAHVVVLIFVGAGAGLFHDKILNPAINKGDGTPPK